MKKLSTSAAALVLLAVMIPACSARTESDTDTLRGRWDLEISYHDRDDASRSLTLYINDIEQDAGDPYTYIAGGCMSSADSDAIMPLSMSAYHDFDLNTYEVVIYSTVVPREEDPYVIRFNGNVEVLGRAISDDIAGGQFKTERSGEDWAGTWNGSHHDTGLTECPSLQDFGILFQGDVYAHQDLAYAPPLYSTLLQGFTSIVSSGMWVEAPDGSTYEVPFYSDIFNPDVDFVSRFEYHMSLDGLPPIEGQNYVFSLLDVFGNPIPGTESMDIWTQCYDVAPRNLQATYELEQRITLSWDSVGTYAREFEPELGFGFYQIHISSPMGAATECGATGLFSAWHEIPWVFAPGDEGTPDGADYGTSLSGLDDGLYEISVQAFFDADPDSGGYGRVCGTGDSTHNLLVEKSGTMFSFMRSGSISGSVNTESGEPIEGILVEACEYVGDHPNCWGATTNSIGAYLITGLFPGEYRAIIRNQPGWEEVLFDGTALWENAARIEVIAGAVTSGIDFSLAGESQ
ncbi:MAG: carboxypeptidase-like regulatory domain-containing protein [Anaerolineales bacterium]